MENLFDWTSEIKPGIILEPDTKYCIECGNDFDNDIIREAFNKIFGKDWVDSCYVGRHKYINIFDNAMIYDSMKNGEPITLSIHYDDKFIYTGWDNGSYFRDNDSFLKFISMEDFINYSRIE